MSNWQQNQLYILKTLEELKADTREILACQHKHDREIDRLKWKSGIISLIGGILAGFGVKLGEWFHS